ncbi:MAG: hypothetical protein ACXVB0_18405 [Mucilaginibacter sp.]
MEHLKTLILSIICLLLLIVIASSCKKDNNKSVAHATANAIVFNSGPVAADGCGWLVKIIGTNEEYSPVNLSSTFQTDSLRVNITYHVLTTKLGCGMAGGGMTQIQLDLIKKQ